MPALQTEERLPRLNNNITDLELHCLDPAPPSLCTDICHLPLTRLSVRCSDVSDLTKLNEIKQLRTLELGLPICSRDVIDASVLPASLTSLTLSEMTITQWPVLIQ